MLNQDQTVRHLACALVVTGVAAFYGCNDSSSAGTGGSATTSGSNTVQGSTTNATSATGSTGSTSATTGAATSSSGGGSPAERCFPFDFEAGGCPPFDIAYMTFGKCTSMHEYIPMWISGPTTNGNQCCYQVTVVPNDPNCP